MPGVTTSRQRELIILVLESAILGEFSRAETIKYPFSSKKRMLCVHIRGHGCAGEFIVNLRHQFPIV